MLWCMGEHPSPVVRRAAARGHWLRPSFSEEATEANRRLADEYGRRMGVAADVLLRATRPHALVTFLITPIPLSVAGGILCGLFFVSLRLPLLIALPLGYAAVVSLGYSILHLAGERGMAMGARAVTYMEGDWRTAEDAVRAIGPSLYHGWTHLAGRRGMLRLHNSLAVAAGWLRAQEIGEEYRVFHFRELARTVEAGRALGGWARLEREVERETRGPLGWLREWTKYQFLGHSRNAYVLGGIIAGRALAIASETGADPWRYLSSIAHGLSMAAAEADLLRPHAPAALSYRSEP